MQGASDFRPICGYNIGNGNRWRHIYYGRNEYKAYQMAPLSMTLSDPKPQFQGHTALKSRVTLASARLSGLNSLSVKAIFLKNVHQGHDTQSRCNICCSEAFCSDRSPRLNRFTRATLSVERVFATATCLSVCLSVTAGIVSKRKQLFMISSPSDSPTISLWRGMTRRKILKVSPQRERFVRVGWVRIGDFCYFSTNKPPYLRNSARYDHGYY